MASTEKCPSSACICKTCEGCELDNQLLCQHTAGEKLDCVCAGIVFVRHPIFILSQQWLLLVINTWAFILATRMIMRTKCRRCYVVSWPLNRLPDELRQKVYERYPG